MEKENSFGKIIGFIIITVVFIVFSSNVLSYLGKEESGSDWCESNMKYITNVSSGKYWMIFREDGFPNSCCTEAGYNYYDRDEGTINYFLFGKHARYMDNDCKFTDGSKWGEENYGVYEEPNKFNKILLGFKYINNMGKK